MTASAMLKLEVEHRQLVQRTLYRSPSSLPNFIGWATCLVYHTAPYFPFPHRTEEAAWRSSNDKAEWNEKMHSGLS